MQTGVEPMLKIITCKREMACSLAVVIMLTQAACSSSSALVDDAVKKLRAARYYYAQGNYPIARRTSSEALYLWRTIEELKLKSYPDWVIKENIRECEELLETLPVSEPIKAVTVVPIRVVKGNILVEAFINQRKNATFILDTGATATILTPEMAALAKLDTGTNAKINRVQLVGGKAIEIPFVILPEIQIGEAVVHNLTVGISSVFPDQPNIGGLLGADFLTHFKLTIDQSACKLNLTDR